MMEECPSCSKEVDLIDIDGYCPYCKAILEVDYEEESYLVSRLREIKKAKRIDWDV